MNVRKTLKQKKFARPIFEAILFIRGLLFYGTKVECPCCGWHFRTFIKSGFSLKIRENGYCPRCNSKSRHRRNYLFLKEETDFFHAEHRLLHIAPKYCLSRSFSRMHNVDYLAIDLQNNLNVGALMNLADSAISSGVMDRIVCIHVLEHIEDDRQAIRELYRVLKPGGWAIISVPIRLDQATYEDPTIESEADRKREFGEKDHVRFYGQDFPDRLREAGFEVKLYLGTEQNPDYMKKFGLLDDENIFLAVKPN